MASTDAPSLPGSGKLAVVTGATGFVAQELIRQLLERGYAVRATARRCDPADARLAALKRAADAAPGTLELATVASLLQPSPELDAAVEGATYVFHVASPFRFDGDPQKDVIEPAIEGTRAVLAAAAAARPRPSRVVVTSSVCAIHDQHQRQPPAAAAAVANGNANGGSPDGGARYTEADWNATSTPADEPYWVSKVEAERLAWKLAGEAGLDVVAILPNFVLGPVLGPGQAGVSTGFMTAFLEARRGGGGGEGGGDGGEGGGDGGDGGAKEPPSGAWTTCDVRDVAAAHIAAAERPEARGRYIVSHAGSFDARFVTDALKAALPGAAEGLPDGARAETKETVDAGKLRRELGIELRPPQETVVDAARSLLEFGYAAPAWWRKAEAAAAAP